MYGGLKKSASRLALVAAAGVLSTNAFAADLGGDCCADLEERVAELEATAARKGTRKQSLEIYGMVNMAYTGWADGSRSNVSAPFGDHNLQTRFGFRGNAKISPTWTAGYSILVDLGDKGRTSTFSQTNDIGSSKGVNGDGTRAGDDYFIRMRDANWWIESTSLGRFTVGRITDELLGGSPDIAGVLHAVGDDPGCNGGGLKFRKSDLTISGNDAIGSFSANCGGPWANRLNGTKWASPTLAGFQFIATYGGNLKPESGNIDSTAANANNFGSEYGVGLRYAGEMSGFRLAGNIGIQYDKNYRDLGGYYQNADITGPSYATYPVGDNTSSDTRTWELGLALMHTATGLFTSGEYTSISINAQNPGSGASPTYAGAREAHRYHLMAGISKNWFGLGNTAIYGEYMHHDNFKYAYNPFAFSYNSNGGAAAPLSGDKMTTWGLGFNQAIDAAAMDLYINYRHYSATDPNLASTISMHDLQVITTGARVKF